MKHWDWLKQSFAKALKALGPPPASWRDDPFDLGSGWRLAWHRELLELAPGEPAGHVLRPALVGPRGRVYPLLRRCYPLSYLTVSSN